MEQSIEAKTARSTQMSQIDKSARSCFVGNIPYEATEEKLKAGTACAAVK